MIQEERVYLHNMAGTAFEIVVNQDPSTRLAELSVPFGFGYVVIDQLPPAELMKLGEYLLDIGRRALK